MDPVVLDSKEENNISNYLDILLIIRGTMDFYKNLISKT